MNLIVAVAIDLLNLYVAVWTVYRILQVIWSIHFPDVATSICAEAALGVSYEQPFMMKHSGDDVIQVIFGIHIVCLAGSQQRTEDRLLTALYGCCRRDNFSVPK